MGCEMLLDFLQPPELSLQLRYQLDLSVPQRYDLTVHLCLPFTDLIEENQSVQFHLNSERSTRVC